MQNSGGAAPGTTPSAECICSVPGAGPCLPFSFVVGRDALRAGARSPFYVRAASHLFSSLAAISGSAATLLKLPENVVVETCAPELRLEKKHT